MSTKNTRLAARRNRQARIRVNIRGTEERPRLCVYRSHKYTYAQLISDTEGSVIVSASSKTLAEKSTKSVDAAKLVGQKIAELAKDKKIDKVVFDRNGYLFHGRVKAVAEGAREAGLEF